MTNAVIHVIVEILAGALPIGGGTSRDVRL